MHVRAPHVATTVSFPSDDRIDDKVISDSLLIQSPCLWTPARKRTILSARWSSITVSASVEHSSDLSVSLVSADRSGTDVYLFYKIKALFPEECVTATQDSHFDLLRFSRSGKQITVVQLETSDPFKRSVYIPAERRKDGPGRMGLEVIYAEYHVSWENKRFKVIVAKVCQTLPERTEAESKR